MGAFCTKGYENAPKSAQWGLRRYQRDTKQEEKEIRATNSTQSDRESTGTANRESTGIFNTHSTGIGQYLEITSESLSVSIENEYGCCCGVGGGVGAEVGVAVSTAVGDVVAAKLEPEPVPEAELEGFRGCTCTTTSAPPHHYTTTAPPPPPLPHTNASLHLTILTETLLDNLNRQAYM